ncbi:hypothetical protein BaRGS_00034156, partial [Batillaria attramentaria]
MVEAAVLAFTAECQMTLAKDPSNYVTSADGKSVLKPEISSDVCSVFCFRHGHCHKGRCICNPGYTGDNCQLEAGKGPQLARIRGTNSTCDVNKRPCRKVFIDASNFEMKDTLTCKVQEVMPDGSLSDDVHVEVAEFLSAGRLACSMPDSQVKTATSVKTYMISATNDGHLFGNSLRLTVFDSVCQSCDDEGCTQKANTCLVNGLCYQDGDPSPHNADQFCKASSSSSQWTDVYKGIHPVLSVPTLTGPDADFLMACSFGADDSSRPADATTVYHVTWLVDGQPLQAENVTPGAQPTAYISLSELQHSGMLSCKVEGMYTGHENEGQTVESNKKILLIFT